MKKVLFALGFVLLITSCVLILYFVFFNVKTIEFNCNEKCTTSPGLSYSAVLDEASKTLIVDKKGNTAFYPYISFSLNDDYSDETFVDKYNKELKVREVKLTDIEVKDLKKLIKLNKEMNNKYNLDILILMLDMIYNKDDYCQGEKSCLNYYKDADKNHDDKVTYKEKADYLLPEYIKYVKQSDTNSKNSKKLDLSEFKCKYDDNSCVKVLNLVYNGFKHIIKIKYYYDTSYENGIEKVTMYYSYYLNDRKIDTIKDTEYLVMDNKEYDNNTKLEIVTKKDLKTILDFSGYLLVVNEKYLGIIRNTFVNIDKNLMTLNIYNEKNKRDIKLPRNINLDDIEVNKNVITFWYPYCNGKKMSEFKITINEKRVDTLINREREMNEKESKMSKEDFGVCYDRDTNQVLSY